MTSKASVQAHNHLEIPVVSGSALRIDCRGRCCWVSSPFRTSFLALTCRISKPYNLKCANQRFIGELGTSALVSIWTKLVASTSEMNFIP